MGIAASCQGMRWTLDEDSTTDLARNQGRNEKGYYYRRLITDERELAALIDHVLVCQLDGGAKTELLSWQ